MPYANVQLEPSLLYFQSMISCCIHCKYGEQIISVFFIVAFQIFKNSVPPSSLEARQSHFFPPFFVCHIFYALVNLLLSQRVVPQTGCSAPAYISLLSGTEQNYMCLAVHALVIHISLHGVFLLPHGTAESCSFCDPQWFPRTRTLTSYSSACDGEVRNSCLSTELYNSAFSQPIC